MKPPVKLLPEKFMRGGFTFTLERRSKRAAIYRQVWNGKEDAAIAYEVVRPVISTKQFIDGGWRDSEPHEVYPSTESWGISGWTFSNLDQAVAKMASLSVHQTRRNRFHKMAGTRPRKKRRAISIKHPDYLSSPEFLTASHD